MTRKQSHQKKGIFSLAQKTKAKISLVKKTKLKPKSNFTDKSCIQKLDVMTSVLDVLGNNTANALLTLVADQFGVAVLHIDANTQNQLVINITNQLDEAIDITQLSGPASSDNWNIKLNLPNNQFYFYSEPTINPSSGDNWELATDSDNGWIQTIYLANTGDSCVIQPKETLQLIIDYISIVPDDSKAINVQVVVYYQDMKTDSGIDIQGNTFPQNLDLMADEGRPSPLIGSFIGSASVLNDGTSHQELTLQLVNTSQDPIQFIVPPQDNPTQSYIEVILPVSDDVDDASWALCNESAFRNITPSIQGTASDGWNVTADPSTIGIYKLTPDFSQVQNIPPQGVIELVLKGVTSSLKPGIVQVQVSLRRVAIYGTQTFGVPLEKTPLIYNPDSGSGMTLSAGALGSNQALSINGDSSSELVHINQSGSGNALLVDGDVTINNTLNVESANISGTASISGPLSANSVQVANDLKAGSANILGTLTVQSLNIGTWTISVDESNNLNFTNNGCSVSFNGNTVIATNVRADDVQTNNLEANNLKVLAIDAKQVAASTSMTLAGNSVISDGSLIWIKSNNWNAALNGTSHFCKGAGCKAIAYWMECPPDKYSNLTINAGNPF